MSVAALAEPAGLQLRADGTPVPDVLVLDLTRPVPEHVLDAIGPAAITLGVADGPLSPAARRVARELTCTLVPAGAEGSPAEVGVSDPSGAVAELGAAVHRCPRAAVTLAALLRVVAQVPVRDALALESSAYSTLLAGTEFRGWLAAHPRPAPAAEPGPPPSASSATAPRSRSCSTGRAGVTRSGTNCGTA